MGLFQVICTFFLLNAHAEYRAFQLKLIDTTSGQERIITSTLDDIQYRAYYPLLPNQTVSIESSWMCDGNTGQFLPICPNPKER